MANITIGELNLNSSLASTASIPFFQDDSTHRTTYYHLKEQLNTDLQATSTIENLTNVSEIAQAVKSAGTPASTSFTRDISTSANQLNFGSSFSAVTGIQNNDKILSSTVRNFTLPTFPSTSGMRDSILEEVQESIPLASTANNGLMTAQSYNDIINLNSSAIQSVETINNTDLISVALGGQFDVITGVTKDNNNDNQINVTHSTIALSGISPVSTSNNGLMTSGMYKGTSSLTDPKLFIIQTFTYTSTFSIPAGSGHAFPASSFRTGDNFTYTSSFTANGVTYQAVAVGSFANSSTNLASTSGNAITFAAINLTASGTTPLMKLMNSHPNVSQIAKPRISVVYVQQSNRGTSRTS